MQKIQSSEIELAAIHDIDSPRHWDKLIKDFDVMYFSIGYGDKRWNVTA